LLDRLRSYFRDGMPASGFAPLRARCVGASDLVDSLPSTPARSAAWAAYALEAYGDALLAACARDGYVDVETAPVARRAFVLAGICVDVARGGAGDVPRSLPHWQTVPRSHEQLVGMRETLESLRTYLAYELGSDDAEIAPIDAELAKVDRLWIAHAPAEIRGGLGDALANGLDLAYALGRRRFSAA
jgi:hypothetical protein